MKVSLNKICSSSVTTILLLFIYACALAIATFIEKYHGTAAAKAIIYHSPLFFFLQFSLIVNFIAIVIKRQYFRSRKWALLITHFAFIIILSGALISFLFGEEGILHLREGETSNRIAVQTSENSTGIHTLPFSVELKKFTLSRYPGSSSPSSYESELIIRVDGEERHERVFMNNVLDIKGYRFFQASYDKDEQGTVLSVSRDVAGRSVTYAGFFLVPYRLLSWFVNNKSRFMDLYRFLKKIHAAPVWLAMFFMQLSGAVNGQTNTDPSVMMDIVQNHRISPAHAERFGSLPMQSNRGRIMPVNTFSSEILRKLHKENTIGQLNSDQFLISLLAMPEVWIHIPFIAISNPELSAYYHLPEKLCSYAQVFDQNESYKLQDKLEAAYNKMPAHRTRFDKDLMKLDEQVNILHQLVNKQMINLFPEENAPDHRWYAPGDDLSDFAGKDSMFVARILDWYLEEVQGALKSNDWTKADEVVDMINTYQQAKSTLHHITPEKIKTEVRYNKMDVFRYCKMGYLILGGLLLILSFIRLFQQKRWIKGSVWALCMLVLLVFFYHTYGMGMRWYIAGYAPWSNSYETMVYVGWATVLAGFLFVRRSVLTLALATLFGGVILFVSGLNWMDPEINPLVPVLKSPWLMFHVAVIVAAYGFFGISCLIGLTNMALIVFFPKRHAVLFFLRIRELTIVNEMSLLVGLALMTIGTFLGAVWANESWGRYWGWDPKETWALITMIVYGIVTHLHLMKRGYSIWLFNVASVIAFSSVLMTFFGVNYFLSGMHSYGQNDNVSQILVYLYVALAVVVMLSFVSYRYWRKNQMEEAKL